MKYAKKSLGQNFLIDQNIKKKIVNLVDIKNKDVVEIGPGKGFLTDEIIKKKPKTLILIEKDNRLYEFLKNKYNKNKNIKIFNKDILKFNLEKQLKEDTFIFGNLPYNISSQILIKVIRFKDQPPKFNSLIFMFQKELAERIYGKFGTSAYGRLSILANFKLKIVNKFFVSKNCFFPKPKVVSAVLHFKKRENMSYNIKKIENLEKITNILFSNRRKMINKNIKKIFKGKNLGFLKNLNLNSRPADLKPDKYYEITQIFERN